MFNIDFHATNVSYLSTKVLLVKTRRKRKIMGNEKKALNARRDFMKKFGVLAAATPPTMVTLLTAKDVSATHNANHRSTPCHEPSPHGHGDC